MKQCDQVRPTCERCAKSRRHCLGYESNGFRYETQLVEQRVHSSKRPPPAEHSGKRLKDHSRVDRVEAIYQCLPPCPEQESLYFFMKHFVLFPRHEVTAGGPVDRLPKLYTTVPANSALAKATIAVELGRAAWYPGRARYRMRSITRYIEATKLVNEAIKDPEESTSDHVLQAVLMLALWQVRSPPKKEG